MNIELLKKVKARILAEPKKFRMDDWNCGTAMCIGGWACSLRRRKFKIHGSDVGPKGFTLANGEYTVVAALRYLGLEHLAGNRLFNENNWPEQFRNRFVATTPKSPARARVAADRIDHFIATNGQD